MSADEDRASGRIDWPRALKAASVTGAVASLATTAAVMLLARAEGRGALRPVNAVSHWLHGAAAGRVRRADVAHTVTGYATNHAASMFWAAPFEAWLATRRDPRAGEIVGAAVATAGVAAVVDYVIVPRRLTPGWEHAISTRSIALTYGALALGLALGGLVNRGRL